MPEVSIDQAIEAAAAQHRAGNLDMAEAMYRQVLAVNPNHPDALNLLGVIARQTGHSDAALELIQRAVNLRPSEFIYRNNLVETLTGLTRFDEAIILSRQLIAERPELYHGWQNLANALFARGQLQEAIPAYERTLAIQPDDPRTRMNFSMLLLLTGDFARGWREHESRIDVIDPFNVRPKFDQPMWRGEELRGKRILLSREQGFGDAIQFIRYAPMVRDRGGHVVVQTTPELVRLFKTVDGVDEVSPIDAPLPSFDVHCPIVSLPYVFNTDLRTIPTNVPYFSVDSALSLQWRQRLPRDIGKINVGLAWAGRPEFSNDRNRSLTLAALAPLAELTSRVQFVSLQVGPKAAEIQTVPQLKLLDFSADVKDFADTAALMQNLDLIISTDTSVPHLAGALGRPVWVMLGYVADWRWLRDRSDSPWYPTLRLFRQPSWGDWNAVIGEAAASLAQFRPPE